jgi:hypothetical protein
MSVHVEEMSTTIETLPETRPSDMASGGSATPAERERRARAARHAGEIACRTRAEGFDD